MRRTIITSVLCVGGIQVTANADAIFAPSYSITVDAKSGGAKTKEDVNIAIGMRQIRLTVSDPTVKGPNFGAQWAGWVDFVFTNGGEPAGNPVFQQSTISDIWFDDGTYTSGVLAPVNDATNPTNPTLIGSSGVIFEWWAKPPSPPGSATLYPKYGVTFSTDAKNPQPHNGIDEPGESLTIRFKLREKPSGGGTYTVNDAIHAVATGELRIAVKMINYANEGSETFIFVPLPGAMAGGMALMGVVGMSAAGRRPRRPEPLP